MLTLRWTTLLIVGWLTVQVLRRLLKRDATYQGHARPVAALQLGDHFHAAGVVRVTADVAQDLIAERVGTCQTTDVTKAPSTFTFEVCVLRENYCLFNYSSLPIVSFVWSYLVPIRDTTIRFQTRWSEIRKSNGNCLVDALCEMAPCSTTDSR